jgi:FkbM family methyltransferase
VFFDIGANIGIYSCLAGKIGADVVSVEPHPENITKLRRNVKLNEVEANIIEGALSDANGTVSLNIDTGYGQSEGAFNPSIKPIDGKNPDNKSIAVDRYTGDEIISKKSLKNPTVMKIDVEGAGPDVLRGFQKTLSSGDCRKIVCEPHGNFEETSNILQTYGYKVETIRTNKKGDVREEPHIEATKK